MRVAFSQIAVGAIFAFGGQRYKKTPARLAPVVSNAINLSTGKPARFGGRMTSAPAVEGASLKRGSQGEPRAIVAPSADAGVVQIAGKPVREVETHAAGA